MRILNNYLDDDPGAGGGGAGTGGDDGKGVADALAARPDNVPEKFWNEESKTVNHEAVLTSYTELEGKFGAFTGAPEAYAFTISDELKEKGVELKDDDPMVKAFTEMAKESNMSQAMANKLVNMFIENEFASGQAFDEAETTRVADEMKLLGDNAETRVKNLGLWATANMDAEAAKGLQDITTTAAGVKAVEALIGMTRNAAITDDDLTGTGHIDMAEIQELQFAKDENGNRKMATDPAYRKMVQDKIAQALPGDNRTIVGA